MKAINEQKWYIIPLLIFLIMLNNASYAMTEFEKSNIQEQKNQQNSIIKIKVVSEKDTFAQGNKIKEIILDNAKKYNLDPNYLLGICLIETGGTLNPDLVGPRTYCGRAKGICQLMPELIKDYEVEDPFNPNENINAGAKHLRYLIDLYKNKKIYDENENLLKTEYVAAIAYNWGQGSVDRMLKNYDCIIIENMPYEARRYLKIITAHCKGNAELVKKLLEE